MADKLFYFLKGYLGFTRKESRGFVFVIPLLLVLHAVPSLISGYLRSVEQKKYRRYLEAADALPEISLQSPVNSDTTLRTASFQEEKGKRGTERKAGGLSRPQAPGLNTVLFPEAGSVELQMVSGVGPVLSARIEAFREKLGGFHSPAQLLEVYGIDGELADKIYAVFPFQARIVRTIAINELEVGELANHPYIGFGEAKVIVAYRKQHGPYTRAADLLQIKIFTEEWVDRIAPYLSF
ncbi:ComEA family DNA-binding protein [Cyclobacterium xiamenense]|uniref:ComEA family DNA-binding protein n=1 Tax=Cyclobacterium xiamenense TaxID=1297121 RepID=UPI0012B9101B|nr:helix-hairpin-helix domain-containing protein [Cyclobacterium xiamenense]